MLRSILVVLVLLVATESWADFVLSGSEHLEVNSFHDAGVLYDSSTANVVSGGNVSVAQVNDEALLRIVGGKVSTLRTFDVSRTDISGGDVGEVYPYGNSSVQISGGNVHGFLDACDTSTVDISGGTFRSGVRALNNSTLTVSGGTLNAGSGCSDNSTLEISGGIFVCVGAGGSSTLIISGGEFATLSGGKMPSVYAMATSTVELSGGRIPAVAAETGSNITFCGYDFRASDGLSLEDEWVVGTGLLTGKWSDGTSWITRITFRNDGTIRVIPEPSTLILLTIAVAGLLAYGWGRRGRFRPVGG